jgi:hypothetical protein
MATEAATIASPLGADEHLAGSRLPWIVAVQDGFCCGITTMAADCAQRPVGGDQACLAGSSRERA